MILPRSARVLYVGLVILLTGLICFNLYRGTHPESEWTGRGRAAIESFGLAEQLNSAAESGDVIAINRLLRSGANVNAITGLHASVLSSSLRFDHFEAARLLIENGADVRASQLGTWPPIVDAAASCAQAVPLLLDKGAGVNVANIRGETPLLAALDTPHEKEIVPMLLAHGADLNARTTNGETVLMRAVRAGEPSLIKLLLRRKADVNAATNEGITALMWARTPETAALLISHGASVNVRTRRGSTPLMAARNSRVARTLLANGADCNARDVHGTTALMATNNTDIVRALLEHGAEVNATDSRRHSALYYALSRDVWTCDLDPDRAVPDSGGPSTRDPTALQMAYLKGDMQSIRALMKRRAESDRKTGATGATVQQANTRRRFEIVKLLRDAGAKE